jgi:hypothetical protein
VQRAWPAVQVPQDSLVLQEHQEKSKKFKDHQAHQALQDLQVHLEIVVQMAKTVRIKRVHEVKEVNQAIKVQLAKKVLPDQRDQLVHQAQMAHAHTAHHRVCHLAFK